MWGGEAQGVEHAADGAASRGGGIADDGLDAIERELVDGRKGLRKLPNVEQGCNRDDEQSEDVHVEILRYESGRW